MLYLDCGRKNISPRFHKVKNREREKKIRIKRKQFMLKLLNALPSFNKKEREKLKIQIFKRNILICCKISGKISKRPVVS